MREFAEQEIILPTGKYAGLRFDVARNPYAGLLLDEFDSGRWRRFFVTGPSQSGKTLVGFCIVILYYLFEMKETVVLGAPTLTIAMDKWNRDLKPLILRTRYASLLPQQGAGSKGGEFESIEFGNDAVLRIMTAGGDDKARSNFTARIAVVTEAEAFGVTSETSVEADKFEQVVARTNHYSERAVVCAECTVGDEEGRTWTEYQNGSASRIAMKCPHCHGYVTPEREHLTGWKDATTEVQAQQMSQLACPACATLWSEEDRAAAMRLAVVAHKGQSVNADGTLDGPFPETYTLGFRWSAANNLLTSMGEVGLNEYKAARSADEQSGERKMCQFFWAVPPKSDAERGQKLTPADVVSRTVRLPKGELPPGTIGLTSGVDLGAHIGHWGIVAWAEIAGGVVSPHLVDYGRFDVPSKELGLKEALQAAIRTFRDGIWKEYCAKIGSDTSRLMAYDGGYQQEDVHPVAAEGWPFTICCKGFGERQIGTGKEKPRDVVSSGDGWRAKQADDDTTPLYEQISDRWKSFVRDAMTIPMDEAGPDDGWRASQRSDGRKVYRPGAMTLYNPTSPGEHLTLGRHVLAERAEETFVPGRGLVRTWKVISRNNHFLDVLGLACVAASISQVIKAPTATQRQSASQPPARAAGPRTADRPAWMPDRPSNWTNR